MDIFYLAGIVLMAALALKIFYVIRHYCLKKERLEKKKTSYLDL